MRSPTARTSALPARAAVASDTPSASSWSLFRSISPAALSSRGRKGDFRQFARSPTASRRAGRRFIGNFFRNS